MSRVAHINQLTIWAMSILYHESHSVDQTLSFFLPSFYCYHVGSNKLIFSSKHVVKNLPSYRLTWYRHHWYWDTDLVFMLYNGDWLLWLFLELDRLDSIIMVIICHDLSDPVISDILAVAFLQSLFQKHHSLKIFHTLLSINMRQCTDLALYSQRKI